MRHFIKPWVFILVFALTLSAQQHDWNFPDDLLQGYAGAIAGSVLKYHSPELEVDSSLLVRSLDAGRGEGSISESRYGCFVLIRGRTSLFVAIDIPHEIK